jgi:putative FmdB family regulatory protein
VPTYQYSCTECGHFFEQVQSFTEDSLTVCPECEGRLRKVFNAVGVVFKGSGFYRTDSRGGGSATDSGPGSGSGSGSGSGKPAGDTSASGSSTSGGEKSGTGSSGGSSSGTSTSSSGSSTAGAGVG